MRGDVTGRVESAAPSRLVHRERTHARAVAEALYNPGKRER
jgi:hypothetical protein